MACCRVDDYGYSRFPERNYSGPRLYFDCVPRAAVSAAPITSNWTPGNAGNWSGGAADAVNWNHSQPPTPPSTQTFPNNNAFDTYSVNIGGASSSNVTLNVNVTVDSLNVSATNTLDLNNAVNLTIAGGNIANSGTIGLNSTGAATQINLVGNNTISGTGTIIMSDFPSNAIRNTGVTDILTHSAGHTIRGGGNVGSNLGSIVNAGTIVADQSTPLIVDPGTTLDNTGILRAEGGGTLQLNGATYNNASGQIIADASVPPLMSPATPLPSTAARSRRLTAANSFRPTISAGRLMR